MRIDASINALVELVDDPDELVAKHVRSKIIEQGSEVLPSLTSLQDQYLDDPIKSECISKLIHHIQFEDLKRDLKNWINSDEKQLLEGVYLVCKYQYPDLTINELNDKLLEIKRGIWLEINSKQTSFEIIKNFNTIFFDHFDFKKSESAHSSLFDIIINAVLETREGSDIALGLIYSIVAQSLNLPVYGVSVNGSSKTFMLAFIDQNNILDLLDWGVHNNGVLFYISVSNKGLIIDPQRLKEIFKSRSVPLTKDQFEPTPNTVIVKNYLKQLASCCENMPHFRYKLKELKELIKLFK
ncbi:MAG: transglutaminase family protein [Brumimicrobium sp.]